MVAASGRGTKRRRRWLIATGIVVVIVAWGLLIGIKMLSAYHHDKVGLAALEQVKANLSPGQLTSSASERLLDQAHVEFVSAQSDLSSPLFAPITVLPVIGRQFRSVQDLSTAAGTVSQVGSTLLSHVNGVLDDAHGSGPARVASLRQLSALSLSAGAQLAAIDTGPTQALVGPLASKRNQFVTQLDDVRTRLVKSAGVSAAVATILQGPQTYLVLASNNAEMRAGSGTFLEVGTASTADGTVQLNNLGPSGDHSLPEGAVKVTGDLQRNWGWLHPSLDMRNLGLTPQFNVTAPLAASMWAASTGQQVDGVLSLDVVGVHDLMEATGPVVVGGQTITADNVEQYLLHDQYAGLSEYGTSSNSRQDALGAIAGAVLRQLQGQTTNLKTLAQAVSSAVAGRHLMMWSKNPTDEDAWNVSGVGGVGGELAYQSVDVSLINVGGNKLDQYMQVHVAVSTKPSGADTAVTLTTRVTNTTPPDQSQYIAGPFLGSPVVYGEYAGVIAANLPGSARHLSYTGANSLAVNGVEGPTWVMGAPIDLRPGDSSTSVFRFVMPGHHGSMTLVPSARVPVEQWTADGKTFDDSVPATISW
jgi:hypothetical protein